MKNVKNTVLAAVTLSLVGCSEKPQDAAQTGSAPSAKEPESLVLYSWGDYHSEEVLELFTERTGIKVDYQVFENGDIMEENLKSNPGNYDLIVIDDPTVRSLAPQRLLRKLDHSKLPNMKNISAEFLNDADDKESYDPGNRYTAPYMWGTVVIGYRKDKIPNPDPSWNLLEDPGLKGKIMLLDGRVDSYAAALIALGKDPNSENLAEIEGATNHMVEFVKRQEAIFGTDMEGKDALESGERWVVVNYSGDMAEIADSDPNGNVGFFIPKEGSVKWIDNFAISRDSKHPEEAHAFIDFMCEPEIAAMSSDYLRFATPNLPAQSLEILKSDLLKDKSIYPEKETLEKCVVLNEPSSAKERSMNLGWRRIMESVESPAVTAAE